MEIARKIMREGRELNLVIEKAQIRRAPEKMEEKAGSKSKWECDIWKLGEENLNGRIYTEKLAERLVEEQPITIVNDGHFCDYCNGQEYENAKAVASGLWIEDGVLKCRLDFLDSESAYEKKLEELASKGVSIGVSSVGYGEYEDDGKTINPETYMVVRLVDFVTTPAGEVYANKVDDDEPEDEDGEEEPEDDGQGSLEQKESLSPERRKEIIKNLVHRRK